MYSLFFPWSTNLWERRFIYYPPESSLVPVVGTSQGSLSGHYGDLQGTWFLPGLGLEMSKEADQQHHSLNVSPRN